MKQMLNIIAFTLMLLLAQSSVAVHDIHCLEGEHDHTCEIYFTQDHTASSNIDQFELELIVYSEKLETISSFTSPSLKISHYHTRAPPNEHF